jgi:hypothetical protein
VLRAARARLDGRTPPALSEVLAPHLLGS